MSAFAQSCDLEGDGYRVRLSRVLTAIRDDLTVNTSDPSRVMMRQIAGLFPQYEKARLVAKLRAARWRRPQGVVDRHAQCILSLLCPRNSWRFRTERSARGLGPPAPLCPFPACPHTAKGLLSHRSGSLAAAGHRVADQIPAPIQNRSSSFRLTPSRDGVCVHPRVKALPLSIASALALYRSAMDTRTAERCPWQQGPELAHRHRFRY
jgi:hypothetical protein